MTEERLLDGFDPLNDMFDRRILYGITGRKLDPEDYWDDSDQDPNADPNVMDQRHLSDFTQ